MSLWGKRADMLVHGQDPYNAEPPAAGLVGRALTPLDTFYSRNHGPVPDVDVGAWRLRVGGLVQRPLELSLAELQADFTERTLTATLQCAGNRRAGLIAVRDIPGEDPWQGGATSTAAWSGVRLGDVLTAAGLREAARHVCFAAPDVSQLAEPAQPYGASVPVAKALSSEVLLAWAMNGHPLTRVHGAPLRVVVPGWIGARSVKWVHQVTATVEPFPGYFQAVAYRLLLPEADPASAEPGQGPSLGPVALNSEILEPADRATVSAGPVRIAGYAYAGDDRCVVRVDVSIDGGATWAHAELDPPQGPWTWQHWRLTVDPVATTKGTGGRSGGVFEVVARAWDSTGALQPERPGDLWNPKGYINNSWPRARITLAARR